MMTKAPTISGTYPTTMQQRAIIAMLTDSSGTEFSYFDLKLAFLVSPRIDLPRLERTFTKLAARHDALRQSFERRGDDWFVNIWNSHRTGLMVEDHGDISDSDFHALLQHHSSLQIDLLDEVLFQAIVLRCGLRGDVLFIRCHHAIADGHSLIILIEDWLNLLIGIPLLGKGVTHEEYLSEYSRLSPQQEIDNEKYWNQLLFPALPNPGLGNFINPGERPRMVHRTDTDRYVRRSLPSAKFGELPISANARSQTSFSIVLAAFADTIIAMSGLPGIYVSTNVDRTSTKLRNYVGCAIVWPPIRCDAANGMPLADYASFLADQLKQNLIHLPSKAAEFESDYDLAINESGGVLRHYFCSMATSAARTKRSPFSAGIMSEPQTPREIGPLTITNLGIFTDDHNFNGLKLRIKPSAETTIFEFSYHTHFYSEEEFETLLLGMQERLHIRLV